MRRHSGFTILEVMVALVIIALALTAVGTKMSQMIDTANAMRDRTYASWIAQNRITEIRLAGQIPDVTTTTGEVNFAGVEWEWRAEVFETGIENLRRVEVAVSLLGADEPVRTVTGFVGEPVAPGQGNRVWITSPVNRGEER